MTVFEYLRSGGYTSQFHKNYCEQRGKKMPAFYYIPVECRKPLEHICVIIRNFDKDWKYIEHLFTREEIQSLDALVLNHELVDLLFVKQAIIMKIKNYHYERKLKQAGNIKEN